MRSIYLFWCLSFGILPTIVCAQTLQDRETRERLLVIEEKLTKMDEQQRSIFKEELTETNKKIEQVIQQMRERQNSSPDHWFCSARCIFYDRQNISSIGSMSSKEGTDVVTVFKNMVEDCDNRSSWRGVASVGKDMFATVENSCVKY